MRRPLSLFGGAAVGLLVLVAGLYAYRSLKLVDGETPEGFAMLTPVRDSQSFEPKALPREPVLANRSASGVAVDFGYKVAGIPYSYTLDLAFPAKADQGTAKVTVSHANRTETVEGTASRRWDAPRAAYAVALEDRFDVDPAVPSLCIKAVIGPSDTTIDLKGASICVAQRDVKGACHPETLACGLIRQ